jgi:hypothetical protein
MRMMRNDTGEIICEERPVYGGTGKLDLSKFDEPGYILQPPCVWGKEEGARAAAACGRGRRDAQDGESVQCHRRPPR